MALDLNISPYYEDYDEGKNYHKILFLHLIDLKIYLINKFMIYYFLILLKLINVVVGYFNGIELNQYNLQGMMERKNNTMIGIQMDRQIGRVYINQLLKFQKVVLSRY